ncbi:MAG: hypothetical protein ACXVKM_06725 [Flavisolibacter sp.]
MWTKIYCLVVNLSFQCIKAMIEDGKQCVKVTISSVFEFYNVLSSNQAAVAQQNTLLGTTNQTVTYKLYYSDGSCYSKSNDGTFKLVYSNQ